MADNDDVQDGKDEVDEEEEDDEPNSGTPIALEWTLEAPEENADDNVVVSADGAATTFTTSLSSAGVEMT